MRGGAGRGEREGTRRGPATCRGETARQAGGTLAGRWGSGEEPGVGWGGVGWGGGGGGAHLGLRQTLAAGSLRAQAGHLQAAAPVEAPRWDVESGARARRCLRGAELAPEVEELVGGLLGEEGEQPQVRQQPHRRDGHPRQRHEETRPLPPPPTPPPPAASRRDAPPATAAADADADADADASASVPLS